MMVAFVPVAPDDDGVSLPLKLVNVAREIVDERFSWVDVPVRQVEGALLLVPRGMSDRVRGGWTYLVHRDYGER